MTLSPIQEIPEGSTVLGWGLGGGQDRKKQCGVDVAKVCADT